MSDNMQLWNKHFATPPSFVKDVTFGGRKFKSIDPYFQLRLATEEWGPYGQRWGLRDLDYQMRTVQFDIGPRTFISLTATFWAPDIEFPIADEIWLGPKSHDDSFKKLLTSCRSKALSLLGFNADVFLGMYDDAKYVTQRSVAEMSDTEQYEEIAPRVDQVSTHQQYEERRLWLAKIVTDGTITTAVHDKLLARLRKRAETLKILNPPADTDPANTLRAYIKQMKVSNNDVDRMASALTDGQHRTIQSLLADPVALEIVVDSLAAKHSDLQLWVKVRESLIGQ